MFDNAGKLEDLNVLINSAFDTSDENLKSIVDNTTKITETGESVGPYIDSKGNPLYSTEEEKKEMIEKSAEDFQKLNEDSKMFILGYMVGIQQERLKQNPDDKIKEK